MKSGRSRAKTNGNSPSGTSSRTPSASHEDREARIAAAAYFKAQARGFQPGHELEDWLAAEAETR